MNLYLYRTSKDPKVCKGTNVHAKISTFYEWIIDNTKDATYCKHPYWENTANVFTTKTEISPITSENEDPTEESTTLKEITQQSTTKEMVTQGDDADEETPDFASEDLMKGNSIKYFNYYHLYIINFIVSLKFILFYIYYN